MFHNKMKFQQQKYNTNLKFNKMKNSALGFSNPDAAYKIANEAIKLIVNI